MLLHRLHLDLHCREVRRDLADPYQMHATLCRAFVPDDQKCPPGTFLWRLEPEASPSGAARVLVQGHTSPDWSRIAIQGWLAEQPAPGIDLHTKLSLAGLAASRRFRYRLRANPSVCRDGKRVGLLGLEDQRNWITRKGLLHGFKPETFHSSQEKMLSARQHNGNPSAYSPPCLTGCWSWRIQRDSSPRFDRVSATGRLSGWDCYRWSLRNRSLPCYLC